MPLLFKQNIYDVCMQILMAAGAPASHAAIVANHLSDANLVGHDSHGIIRIIQYVKEIQSNEIDPTAEPEITKSAAATASVDGHHTFGQVVATFATNLAMDLARKHGISVVTMSNHGHTGRIGSYPELVAQDGMAAMMYTGLFGGPFSRVAPFGGREARLGTNPLAVSFPYKDKTSFLLDFATSVAAEGKFRVYRARGEQLPDQWVISSDGVPSADPNDLYSGGSMLPLGGLSSGHKGYALSMMVSFLGAVLARLSGRASNEKDFKTGSSIIVIDLKHLGSEEMIASEVEALMLHVKDTPPIQGTEEVLYPGELEARTRAHRMQSGVQVEQATWDTIKGLLADFGLATTLDIPD